ncbi:hypothetical protein Dsin_019027 [Dipteronia sinensis]|uniref:Zinc knuckle CX2CX4HX4C domain-containing protein n=1 Tax=Dipteronia sinensis TaxID=43782 RepID=A0AAE0A6K5_9ROSI|nr:hypothetical protein Dsin_019027 [Dipteronia sinensis]
MRVRVKVQINVPLIRCLRVDNMGDGVEFIMLLMYERLPKHCFKCGMVDHTTTECILKEPIPIINGVESPHYLSWMRASPPFSHYRNGGRPGITYGRGHSGNMATREDDKIEEFNSSKCSSLADQCMTPALGARKLQDFNLGQVGGSGLVQVAQMDQRPFPIEKGEGLRWPQVAMTDNSSGSGLGLDSGFAVRTREEKRDNDNQ